MTFLTALFGGFVGFGCQVFANAIRKVPLSRRTFLLIYCHGNFSPFSEPWMHAGMLIAGCYVGNAYPKWERKLVDEINAERKAKGLSPMVGTNAWIRYKIPEEEEQIRK